MKILLAGVLGGIVMFVWTSIAHMALPLGEAGINEIPNESAVLKRDAEQYRRQDRPLYFSRSWRWQKRNARGKERGDETDAAKNSREPFRHSHVSSARPSVRIWQIARYRIQHRSAPGNSGDLAIGTDTHWQLCWPSRFRSDCRNSGRDNNQRFVLELVRLPWRIHRQLYTDRDCQFRSRWSYCRAGAAKA